MSSSVRRAADRAMEIFRGEDPQYPGLEGKWPQSVNKASRIVGVSPDRVRAELTFRRKHFGPSKKTKPTPPPDPEPTPTPDPEPSEVQGAFGFVDESRMVIRRMLEADGAGGASGGSGGGAGASGGAGGTSGTSGAGNVSGGSMKAVHLGSQDSSGTHPKCQCRGGECECEEDPE